ncbi:Metal-dependent hydrolase, endonuclease/exonuclease/phosphatase family [Modestobacter sp. DSM 44400]|uniref:endonuclease/exonuclease/phosphatase family protein n=1 Tax=Modestobacter sp. DSM 44400 TaxID=1550230 RepID=UPI000899E2BC|nr:endonuclease/exonuclease/phosphatase family protein [Modestobacter sp. DSM 44400]SDY39533.1 Metal-dependent hydrolase, endonuclease/exonuclease/phosphatase family [Modestobacter sp. DSM 44400]
MVETDTVGSMRVGTLNLASGRDGTGRSVDAAALRAALADVDVDVLAVQEIDVGQPRSHGLSQPAEVAAALGAGDWRFAATVDGTPDPFRSWQPVDPPVLTGPDDAAGAGPRYGIALFSRRPVRRWSVQALGTGRARLPVRAPDPRTGRARWWWFPDEPRLAVAAELDGCTVVGTHLSFAPHTAVRQLLRLRRWARELPGPVLLTGDLNLAGPVPERVTGATRLVSGPTYPGSNPRLQYDHVLTFGPMTATAPDVRVLPVGDHRLVTVTVALPERPKWPLWPDAVR